MGVLVGELSPPYFAGRAGPTLRNGRPYLLRADSVPVGCTWVYPLPWGVCAARWRRNHDFIRT